MFNKKITDTIFTSEAAERLFSNTSAHYAPDATFLTTLRILLQHRLPQNHSVSITCKPLYLSLNELTGATTSQAFTWFLQDAPLHPRETAHHIHIVYTTSPEVGAKMLEIVNTHAGTGRYLMQDFTAQEDLHIFYARKVKARFLTHESRRSTIIFAERLKPKQFHALQMMMPKYLPELFANIPLNPNELKLLKSLGNKSATEYENIVARFANAIDMRAEVIRTKLAGFETIFERMRIDELKQEIAKHQRDYQRYMELARDTYQLTQERTYTLAGFENVVTQISQDSELMEYFMCNKNLTIIKVKGTAIELVVHGYGDVYDLEAFQQYAPNHRGYMYQGSQIPPEQMEKLYNAIFQEGIYKLRICAAFRVDIRDGIKALQQYPFPPESKTYFPNPHIQHFACIGNYAARFQEYIQNRDYVGAIDQAVVSARNINFYDSTVMARFAESLSRTAIKCIEAPDGILTPQEAIAQLEGGTPCQDP